ncbi:MAG: deoxyhypusine synthase family protein [Candidatus Thermoplasmatota archaeon]|nr:deoxyhypusine synthase family protein [Candidatus Thermoplasmatota archaeon]
MTDDVPTRDDLLMTPIRMLDVSDKVTIGQLMEGFANTSFQARRLSQCLSIYERMLDHEGEFSILMGLSGAMVAAGLRKIVSDLIRSGYVDVVVTTGAIVYQDFYQARGYRHYRGDPNSDDVLLHSYMIDRIYDTYVDEDKFRETDVFIGRIMEEIGGGRYSTREFLSILGSRCINDPDSILGAAHSRGVPVYCPAIADSSIGIGLATAYKRARDEGKPSSDVFLLDTIRDNYEIAQIVHMSSGTGAVYLGGGVPKNYINDAVVMADMLYGEQDGHEYAFQITMDRAEWGGLSGSTLGEAQSWGKILAEATHTMAHVELSVALPLIAGAVMERREGKPRKGRRYTWDGDSLLSI